TTVSSLYRRFSLTAGGTDVAQADRIRVSIAGYVDGTVTVNGSSYRNWTGYIDSATAPSGTVTSIANSYITDRPGTLIDDSASAAGTTNHTLNTLTISTTETELYGTWDTSAPVFAPFRSVVAQKLWSSYSTAPENYEAIGNTATGSTGSTLDRIEFHLYDNAPSYSAGDSYAWFSRRGWCTNDLSASLYTSYSYAADLFGGSRPFDGTAAARTSGGIRYSSVYGSMQAFKYAVGSNKTPVVSFDTGTPVTGGATGAIFSTTTDTYNTTGTVDGLYFAVYLSDKTLARKSQFTVSYDADTGFVTDLAGNRLKSATINTIDLTPPEFNMTISPVGNNFLYVIFSKALNLTKNGLLWIDEDGKHYIDPLTEIPKSLELVDKSTGSPSTGIAIDEDTPAVKVFQNDDYTGLIFKLKRSTGAADEGNVRLSDIENVYVRIKKREASIDPVTGLSGTYVSYIQDSIGNSMPLYDAHAFSDFAVNVVNPQYAYNVDADSNISDVISSYHNDGSWAVHDWSADQKNYGTLMLNKGVLIHAGLADGTSDYSDGLPVKVTAYFDPDPDSSAVSVTYNSNTSQSWRIWLPGGDDIFEALAPANNPQSNKGFASTTGVTGSEDKTHMDFILSADSLSSKNWKAGDQVKFLFGLVDSSGNPVKIRHVPVFNGDSTGGTYSGTEYPLFALRLTQNLSNSDALESAGKKIASSLDLWSFRLKSLVSQRGGVTILNNVINASTGETTVVKVTMPSDGSLSVVVMTLDGDIVQYLQHGTTTSGDHYYKWNGTTKSGKRVARGMYFIRVFGTGIDETRKVMVVKD
ncbi:MAG: FlgD immunoglobulin-like domain containing protein, partial [Treponema sp.]